MDPEVSLPNCAATFFRFTSRGRTLRAHDYRRLDPVAKMLAVAAVAHSFSS